MAVARPELTLAQPGKCVRSSRLRTRRHTRFPFLGSSGDELPGYALGLASNGTRTPHPIKAVPGGTKVEIVDRPGRQFH